MLIHFDYLFKKFKIDATGVLHIGAHTGEEAEFYYRNGIKRSFWIEANPEIFPRLQEHIKKYPDAIAVNMCIGDEHGKEVEFNVSSNDGQSSSYLELGAHATVHPDVTYVKKFTTQTFRVDGLFNSLKDYTFLNIDLQGAEMDALVGMGDLLNDVDYAYLEVNKDHLYKNCPLIGDIDEYLSQFDFVRVETSWAGNTGWGDALYIRSTKIPKDGN